MYLFNIEASSQIDYRGSYTGLNTAKKLFRMYPAQATQPEYELMLFYFLANVVCSFSC